jgi:hypothetical protein
MFMTWLTSALRMSQMLNLKDVETCRGYVRVWSWKGNWLSNYIEAEKDFATFLAAFYAVIKGNRYLCPSIYANHNTFGNVLLKPLFSDNQKVNTYLLETIDLKFLVRCPKHYRIHLRNRRMQPRKRVLAPSTSPFSKNIIKSTCLAAPLQQLKTKPPY